MIEIVKRAESVGLGVLERYAEKMKTLSLKPLLLSVMFASLIACSDRDGLEVESSTFYIENSDAKLVLENVGPKNAYIVLKNFWVKNRDSEIVIHNEYFRNNDEIAQRLNPEQLARLGFDPEAPFAKIAPLTLKYNKETQEFELYTTQKNTFLKGSKNIDDILERAFEIQYPKGYEDDRLKALKVK